MLEKFKKYFSKEATEDNNQTSDSVIKNWFENRYDSLIVQRNILFVFLLISVGVVILSIFAISYIATSKDFEPFVIQVQKDTGITTVVNPVSSQVLDGNDALARYFIKEYVSSRETYNPVDFDTRSRTLIKLMSNPNIYSEYLGYISNDTNNPSVIYASNNTTYLKTKSWSKLSDGSFVYRFSVNETTGQKKIYSKIVIISFTYNAIELSEDQQDINPVGFTVTGYRVDDDNS